MVSSRIFSTYFREEESRWCGVSHGLCSSSLLSSPLLTNERESRTVSSFFCSSAIPNHLFFLSLEVYQGIFGYDLIYHFELFYATIFPIILVDFPSSVCIRAFFNPLCCESSLIRFQLASIWENQGYSNRKLPRIAAVSPISIVSRTVWLGRDHTDSRGQDVVRHYPLLCLLILCPRTLLHSPCLSIPSSYYSTLSVEMSQLPLFSLNGLLGDRETREWIERR